MSTLRRAAGGRRRAATGFPPEMTSLSTFKSAAEASLTASLKGAKTQQVAGAKVWVVPSGSVTLSLFWVGDRMAFVVPLAAKDLIPITAARIKANS